MELGFLSGAVDKESACQCRGHKRCGFNPWAGKIPWNRKWQPTPVVLPGKFDRWRVLAGYRLWSCKELDTTEHTCKNMLELDNRELVWAGVIHFHSYHYIAT